MPPKTAGEHFQGSGMHRTKKKNRTEKGMGPNESRTRAAEARPETSKKNDEGRGDEGEKRTNERASTGENEQI